MLKQSMSLPSPAPAAFAQSEELRTRILNRIAHNGGKITFEHYMEMALYDSDTGYYSSNTQKLGAAGDFVTAPEISALFSRCIANQCQQILNHLVSGSILEFGAGSGAMAADILKALDAVNCLPEYYYIIDISPYFRQRQQHYLSQLPPELYAKIIWLESLPETFTGIILANEVVDAFPVRLFSTTETLPLELFVCANGTEFEWQTAPIENQDYLQQIECIQQQFELPSGYQIELNTRLPAWIAKLSNSLTQGAIFLIDYGFPQYEYYHPQRTQGTLMCHYRHAAHSDPFFLPGLQDITAHVDFTAIAKAASEAKLHVAGYNTQAGFLAGCGIAEYIKQYAALTDMKQQMTIQQQLRQLTSLAEMGELFKVMALTRNLDIPLIGFGIQDLRGRL